MSEYQLLGELNHELCACVCESMCEFQTKYFPVDVYQEHQRVKWYRDDKTLLMKAGAIREVIVTITAKSGDLRCIVIASGLSVCLLIAVKLLSATQKLVTGLQLVQPTFNPCMHGLLSHRVMISPEKVKKPHQYFFFSQYMLF